MPLTKAESSKRYRERILNSPRREWYLSKVKERRIKRSQQVREKRKANRKMPMTKSESSKLYRQRMLNSERREDYLRRVKMHKENRKLRHRQFLQSLTEEERAEYRKNEAEKRRKRQERMKEIEQNPQLISNYESSKPYFEDYRRVKSALPKNIEKQIILLENMLKDVREAKEKKETREDKELENVEEVQAIEENEIEDEVVEIGESDTEDEFEESEYSEDVEGPIEKEINVIVEPGIDPLNIKVEESATVTLEENGSCSTSNYETSEIDSIFDTEIKIENEEVQEVVLEDVHESSLIQYQTQTDAVVAPDVDDVIMEVSITGPQKPDFWQPETTKLFLDLFKKYRSLFYNHSPDSVYNFISTKILELVGVDKSPEECQTKYNKLIRIYKAKKTKENPTRFPYYQQMDEIQNEMLEIGVDSVAEKEFENFQAACEDRGNLDVLNILKVTKKDKKKFLLN